MKHIYLLTTALFITACAQPAQDPKAITQQYWQAIIDGDIEAAKLVVSTDSQAAFEKYIADNEQNQKVVAQVALDEQRTTVTTTINPDAAKPHNDRPFDTILVIEEGKWKVDASQTRPSVPYTEMQQQLNDMANELSHSMNNNLDDIEKRVGEGMELLNEMLRDGSQEMSDAFLKGMEEMKEAMRESIDKMKQRRMQEQQQHQDTPQDSSGEGMI